MEKGKTPLPFPFLQSRFWRFLRELPSSSSFSSSSSSSRASASPQHSLLFGHSQRSPRGRVAMEMDGGGAAGGGSGGGGEELTAQETALYGGQIRVWGVDAQRTLSKPHVLVRGMTATAIEGKCC